jgi:hypothetical protein
VIGGPGLQKVLSDFTANLRAAANLMVTIAEAVQDAEK